MRVSEFLDVLYDSPRDWKIDSRGRIIRKGRTLEGDPINQCPWLYVAAVLSQQKRLYWGLDMLDGSGAVPDDQVWHAADGRSPHNPKIRTALLKACGLT